MVAFIVLTFMPSICRQILWMFKAVWHLTRCPHLQMLVWLETNPLQISYVVSAVTLCLLPLFFSPVEYGMF